MKKNFFLIIALLINNFLFAQIITISDSIIWQSNKIFNYNENHTINILSFENCDNRRGDYLPVYLKTFDIKNHVNVTDISIINVQYEVLDKSSLIGVDNLDKILEEPEIKTANTTSRLNNYLEFELVPLRRNKVTGNIERIIYFECKVSYTDMVTSKNTRAYATNSKLASGKWYKVKVKESGMYKITYSQLMDMGFNSFNYIGIFGYGGMVPKVIGNDYIDDLIERPVYRVDANSNSIFDEGDYLLFYADGPNKINYTISGFNHEFHNYSEYSYYFVSDQGTWKQPTSTSSLLTYGVTLTTCDDYKFLEKDSLNITGSGRRFFWTRFDARLTSTYMVNLENPSATDDAEIRIVTAINSSYPSTFSVNITGNSTKTINVDSSTPSNYAAIIKDYKTTFRPISSNTNITITYNRKTSTSQAWLDFISINYRKNLSLSNGWTSFRDINTVGISGNVKFVIDNAVNNTIVWDVTDRFNILKVNGNYTGGKYEIIVNQDNLREFVAFNPNSNFVSPITTGSSDVGLIKNQNLHAEGNVDLIIVTHPDFYSQAQGIKSLHERYDNMKVVLTTPEQIYNEFSSGAPDVAAIRNYVKMFYDRASSNANKLPSNLLLLGDGSYDNLSTDPKVTNFILTFETEESLSLYVGDAFVSDDFYVCMDVGEGLDYNSYKIDLGVGRIPVKTSVEAENYLNKLRSYYGTESYSSWKNSVLLISDDADVSSDATFQRYTAKLLGTINENFPVYNVESIFLDDYEQISTVQGHRYPDVNAAINEAISNGVVFVNWIGHGNPKGWAHESVLTMNMLTEWKNTNKYPVFMTGTCDFAPYDNHEFTSAGEEILLNPIGGGIALFTTTRTVYAASGNSFSEEFTKNIFDIDEYSEINTLGISIMNSKGVVNSKYSNDFTLLGDPAIRLPLPKLNVKTTKVNNIAIEQYNDTVKAKSLVKFEGVIENANGQIAEDFNGIIYPVVYDKFMTYTTRGNDNFAPLDYRTQKNIIFKGQAKVVNGHFSFSFIVPIDIAYFFDSGKDFGKVSYYAANGTNTEARGYYNTFIIGGTDENAVEDSEGPIIELYMNSEQFVQGGITDENPIFIAKVKDESGINTIGNGIGHDIILTIDDNSSDVTSLNKFYESAIDDFTSGTINYPMSKLSMGQHILKLKVWDVFNNSNEATTDFIVTSSAELAIDYIFNYPNPFSTNTSFYFAHNQPNVKLDVLIQIFTVSGKHVKTIKTEVYGNGFQSSPIPWDGLDEYGDKIARGAYIYKIGVRAPDGSKVEKFEKLVILN